MNVTHDPAPGGLGWPAAVAIASVGLGYGLTRWSAADPHNRMLPWILGRSLGIAAYLCLVALVGLGLWFGHPVRRSGRRRLHPASVLRLHAALAVATLVLALGHVAALVMDHYARLGVLGAVLPGRAGYRAWPVAAGTLGLYAGLVAGLSAALAGGMARRIWLPIHRLAAITVGLIWFHAVLAGTDTPALRWMYILTGGLILLLGVSRHLLPQPVPS
ncbi:MAG TPA: hypothetical protein VNF50_00350 [Acidimicrobiales bacterium]|nr:hypothetical protein [Acidimicrobiales bacterium]